MQQYGLLWKQNYNDLLQEAINYGFREDYHSFDYVLSVRYIFMWLVNIGNLIKINYPHGLAEKNRTLWIQIIACGYVRKCICYIL